MEKYNVYIQPLVIRFPIFCFSVPVMPAIHLHTPNGVVHTNTTPGEEEITRQTRGGKLSNVDFGNATSLLM